MADIFPKSVWVLGTGDSSLQHKEKINLLNDHFTLGFQNFFPHCIKYYNFIPKAWTWYDPSGAVAGLNYLSNLSDTQLKKQFCSQNNSMKIIIPEYAIQKEEVFNKYAITKKSLRGYNYKNHYLDKLLKLRERGVVVETFRASSFAEKKSYDIWDTNFDKRFDIDSVVISSSKDSYEKPVEHKLPFFILPLCVFHKVKRIYVIGFDGAGAQFFNKQYNSHKWIYGSHEHMSYWKEAIEKKRIDLEIFNLGYSDSPLSKYVKFLNFEEALVGIIQ